MTVLSVRTEKMKKLIIIAILFLATVAHAKDGPNIETWEPLQVIVSDTVPNVVVINGSEESVDPEFGVFYGSVERAQFGTLFTPGHDIRVQPFD